MTTQPMSSRLQGLKFMQRGAQRAALQAEKEAPSQKKVIVQTKPSPPSDADHWVVPFSHRAASPQAEDNWDAWLMDATSETSVNTRSSYGDWKATKRTLKMANRLDTRTQEDAQLPASEEESSDDSEAEDNSDVSGSEEEFLSAPSSPPTTFQKPPSAVPRIRKAHAPAAPAPKRQKQVAVADKTQSLRKKKQR
ncbi:hypothetical protein MNAN1_003369 [Malassezia nana]|uniref:Uncharacterized protein n=1 Tax=Malassezia nana TaxID=180528 RepID=A0AAF0J3X2_9BASI|nr:hypothetical protein MNAN1_003369 [Malassezia nana]